MKDRRRLEPIAIIGLGAVMPEADNVEKFWSNIESGKDCIGEVPADRWDWKLYFDADPKAKDKTYSKIGGFIRGFEFNPLPFRIPPPVAAQMDGIQKLAVVATAQALADAGYDKKAFDSERTAVILGNSMGGPKKDATDLRIYSQEIKAKLQKSSNFATLEKGLRDTILKDLNQFIESELPSVNEDSMPGELSNVMAGRVANVFNLNGPNFTVDAACASSLAALDAAVKGLRLRDFDMVVCGAVDQMMAAAPYVKFSKIGALSPDGSRPFDDRANGFVMGEGAGVYILKRLSDAVKDGDRIYAVIRAIGSSSDGKGKGITAPNPKGQRLAIDRAFAQLEYGPESVGLVEAHGTSTPVGDSTEATVLGQVFAGRPAGSVGLGSVKSQIGHLKAAAGAASIIKTALALHKKTLPPSIHYEVPNRNIDFKNSPLRVITKAEAWPNGKPRRANVSAFGFGGTNFHVALEEYHEALTMVAPSMATGDAAPMPAEPLPAAVDAEAFVVTAESVEALKNRLMNLAPEDPLLQDAQGIRTETRHPFMASFAARNAAEAVDKAGVIAKALGHESVWSKPPAMFRAKGLRVAKEPARQKVAFLFPGQGSQYVDMMRDLALKYRVVADTFAEADSIMTPLLGQPLTSIVWSAPGETPEQKTKREERIKSTEITQPAVLTGDVAMLRLLKSFGVTPDVVAGHSLGEYGALVAAGILEFKDALLAVSARAKEMAGVKVPDPGKMASIAAPWERVQKELAGIPGYVAGANRNCPIQTVIAGETKAVEAAIDKFNALGIQAVEIRVSHAFHSKIVAPAQDAYRRFLGTLDIKAPSTPITSNVTAEYYPKDAAEIRELLVRQIASPVEWTGQVDRMYADGVRVFVEVGPKRVLTAFVSSILEKKEDAIALASNHPKRGGLHEFNETLAGLEAAGVKLDWKGKEIGGNAYTSEFNAHAARPRSAAIPEAPVCITSSAPAGMDKFGFNTEAIVVSGISAGVPGTWDAMFRESGLDELLRGQNMIEKLTPEKQSAQLGKNITRVHKSETGHHEIKTLSTTDEVVKLAGQRGELDLVREFGVPQNISDAMDITFKMALAAGLLALKDAHIPLVRKYKRTSTGSLLPQGWALPESTRDSTGIIFASAFAGFDALVDELTRYYEAKAGRGSYAYSRDFLLKTMGMGHGQLAQFIGARGPAAHIDAACASTTEAVGMAEDWIRLGRAKRVIIVGADDLTNERLQEWFVTGFLAAGAATTESAVSRAALPFDRRRHGMIVGSGAVGLVIEEDREAKARGVKPLAELIATQFENSAFHPTRLDTEHVSQIMGRLLAKAERRTGLKRSEMASKMLFMSHETYTPARGGSASAEVVALKTCFGADAGKVIVANTKGFHGHSMGASIEDAVEIRALVTGKVPPIANYKEADPELAGIRLSDGGTHELEYGLRLAAGFGSQTAMSLIKRLCRAGEPRVDAAKNGQWLKAATGAANPELEVVHNTLRVKDNGAPARAELVEAPKKELAPAPAAAVASVSLSEEKVREEVLALVGEKTGYPREMLELDLDMEADLGIDTVKQAELFGIVREKYSIPRKDGLSLKQYPTLRHVIRYVLESNGAPAISAPAPVAAAPVQTPAPVAAAPAPAAQPVRTGSSLSEETVRTEVLELVAQKTGYPNEMLELDLDMEADLGIDTVKQAELFGIVREKYSIPRKDGLSLKEYPTLRHVIKYVLESSSSAAPAPVEAPAAVQSAKSESKVRRRVLNWTETPLPSGRRKLAEGSYLLVGAPRTLKAFQKRLEAEKLKTVWIQTKPMGGSPGVDLADAKALDAALAKAMKKGPIAGLIYLPGLELGSDEAPEAFEAQYRGSVRPLFSIAKALREDLSKPGAVSAVVTAMGGRHAPEADASPLAGALTGMAKALSRELNARFAAVDFGGGTADAVASATVNELLSPASDAEVGYAQGKRLTCSLAETKAAAGKPRFAAGDVLLVTGGARGLGAEFAKSAAARWSCRLAVLGRTPLREESRAWAALDEKGLADLKSKMWHRMREEQGKKATPAALEREFSKVKAAIELRRSLEAMGSNAAYFECDLSRRESVRAAVSKALETFGRVDAVVHAAGLEESKKLEDKTLESFDAVFRAKAHGLRYVLEALPKGQRSHLFFSSVVGRFGNVGQIDYAGANDCLAKFASRLSSQGQRAVAVDLGAFAEVGMATRGGVKLFLEQLGVAFMKPAEGVGMMLAELDIAEGPSEIVLDAGLGALEEKPAKAETIVEAVSAKPAAAAKTAARTNGFRHMLEGMTPKGDGAWIGSKKFSLESDPYLADHAIAGTPYVPGVMGLEIFAQALWEIDSPEAKSAVKGFTDVRFALPIKLLRNKPLAVRALAKKAAGGTVLELESDFVTPQGVKLGGPRTHFTAKSGELPPSRFDGAKPGFAGKFDVPREAIYKAYFHGESFQVLEGIVSVSPERLVSKMRTSKPLWNASEKEDLLISPLILEAAFQTCGYRDLHYDKRMTLPDSIGAVRVHASGSKGLFVEARYKGRDAQGRSVYDAFVVDADGKLAAELQDYKMIGA
jgi:malonyl CoA-acyl carrier protein transacylase